MTTLRARLSTSGARRAALLSAAVLFVALAVASVRGLPDDTDVNPWLAAIVVLLVMPWTFAANAAEYRTIGALLGHGVSWRSSVHVTVVASAANLLPLPGAVLVRTQALRSRGSGYRTAFSANLAAGVAWLGCGGIALGIATTGQVPTLASWGIGAAGAGALVAGWLLARRLATAAGMRHVGSVYVRLVCIEALHVFVNAVRVYLAFRLLGQEVSAAEAIALSASVVIAAAIGIFPAGLGLRELLAGGIAAAMSVDTATAVAATVMDRCLGLVATALFAGLVVGVRPAER